MLQTIKVMFTVGMLRIHAHAETVTPMRDYRNE